MTSGHKESRTEESSRGCSRQEGTCQESPGQEGTCQEGPGEEGNQEGEEVGCEPVGEA
jgi:hypothetical protein